MFSQDFLERVERIVINYWGEVVFIDKGYWCKRKLIFRGKTLSEEKTLSALIHTWVESIEMAKNKYGLWIDLYEDQIG